MKKIFCSLAVFFLLTACGSGALKDDANENYMAGRGADNTKISGVDFFMDTNKSMADLASQPVFKPILYSAYSASMEVSLLGADDVHIYDASHGLDELGNDFITVHNPAAFQGDSRDVITAAAAKIQPGRLSLIVSDLSGQLTDYAKVSDLIIQKIFTENKMAMAVIGVDASAKKSLFLFVIGPNDAVSRFITAFKQKPDVVAFAGQDPEFQLDEVRKLNVQIFANENGILGIHYANIRLIENGVYYQAVPANFKDGDLLPGQSLTPSGRFVTRAEAAGSLTEVNDTYTDTETVEGSVNISDMSDASPKKVLIYPRNGGSRTDFKYLAVSPLVKEKNSGVAAKIKLEIPFDIINGVRLSNLDCSVSTRLYTSGQNVFVPYKGETTGLFQANVAESAIPEQGKKWRVDDRNNSIVFNIILPDAAALPTTAGEVNKLDVTFKYFASKENVPAWVKAWDRTKADNLMNLFYQIFALQTELNSSEHTFTLYIQ